MEGIMILWLIVILWVVIFITKKIKLRLSKCPKCKQTGASRQTIMSSKARYKVFFQCNTCGHSYNISYQTKNNNGGDNYGNDGYGGTALSEPVASRMQKLKLGVNMFNNWKKNRAIKKILRILPSGLQKRYDSKEYYTIGQLNRTLEEENINPLYSKYALVMFLSPDDAVNALGSAVTYQNLRKDIADQYFNGNINFKIKEIVSSKTANSGHSSVNIDSAH